MSAPRLEGIRPSPVRARGGGCRVRSWAVGSCGVRSAAPVGDRRDSARRVDGEYPVGLAVATAPAESPPAATAPTTATPSPSDPTPAPTPAAPAPTAAPTPTPAATPPVDDVAAAAAQARASGKRVEVVSKETGSSTTWAKPSGKLTTSLLAAPVRVRRGTGWVPVDTTLVAGPPGAAARSPAAAPGCAGSPPTPIGAAAAEPGRPRHGHLGPGPTPTAPGGPHSCHRATQAAATQRRLDRRRVQAYRHHRCTPMHQDGPSVAVRTGGRAVAYYRTSSPWRRTRPRARTDPAPRRTPTTGSPRRRRPRPGWRSTGATASVPTPPATPWSARRPLRPRAHRRPSRLLS